mgnify:CR=1 FL=1
MVRQTSHIRVSLLCDWEAAGRPKLNCCDLDSGILAAPAAVDRSGVVKEAETPGLGVPQHAHLVWSFLLGA